MQSNISKSWRVIGSSENRHCRRIFSDEEYIATVGGSDQSTETIEANANLISVAPEMFDIIELLATIEWMSEKELSMWVRKSREILKKVKGT
jgi:hypothetical protein